MTSYQIKGARLLLRMSQFQFAHKLGITVRTVSLFETRRRVCPVITGLAIRWLLAEVGLFAHFRMTYMRKDKMKAIVPDYQLVTKKQQRNMLIDDALKFKYNK